MLTSLRGPVRVALFLGLVTVGGCTSVRPIHPTTYLEDHAPRLVWVTYHDSIVVSVAEAEVRRDTLRGTVQGSPVRIPLAEIQSVEAKVHDHTKTALLVGSLGVAAVSALYFGSISKSGPNTSMNCGYDQRGFPLQYC